MNKIIEDIKTVCSDIFEEKLLFIPLNKTFIITGNNLSPALNNHNGNFEDINVLKWFNDFWIYIIINFKQQTIESKFPKGKNKADYKEEYFELLNRNFLKIDNDYYIVNVSLSVFQGGYQKEDKKQLFRAEWDNYNDNKYHPQPHWHFYPDKIVDIDFGVEAEIDFLEDMSKKEIDIKQMHFAMNGQWAINGDHIHKINESKIIVNWLNGVLRHIKDQLEKTKTIEYF